MSDAQPDDSLFLHYSGHGTQNKDVEGDEVDGQDEVIIPVDFKKAFSEEDGQLRIFLRNLEILEVSFCLKVVPTFHF